MASRVQHERFHGRIDDSDRMCDHPDCMEMGEFRAPKTGHRRGGFDGPGDYHWLCLAHVREFNARYDFFDGMSQDEIYQQQRPWSGWDRETRAFAGNGASPTPHWSDFTDPLDAIGARFKTSVRFSRQDGKPLSDQDRENLQILGLNANSDRKTLRRRYTALVRKYHPDKNGGDRSHEKMLQRVIDAYTQLKDTPAFS